MIYTTTLRDKEIVAEKTMAFRFEKPADFEFRAGQFTEITLLNPPETDDEGNLRTFSIASAPHEPDLIIATRLRDTAFKHAIRELEIGKEVKIEGPFGDFVLHQNVARPAIFLVGGIGITPFRSMILDATERALSRELHLFFSNRRPEDAAFMKDLEEAAARNSYFHFIPTMTQMANSQSAWSGETGYISEAMIKRHISLSDNPLFYSAGPPKMVLAMKKMLMAMGVSEDDIRIEEFPGY